MLAIVEEFDDHPLCIGQANGHCDDSVGDGLVVGQPGQHRHLGPHDALLWRQPNVKAHYRLGRRGQESQVLDRGFTVVGECDSPGPILRSGDPILVMSIIGLAADAWVTRVHCRAIGALQ